MCHLHCLIIFSLIQNHFGYGGILGGPNVAIGYLFNWGVANCQSHSFLALEGARTMVCFASSLPTPHPLTQSTQQVSAIPSLTSYLHLTSRVAWFVCAM